MLQSPRNQSDTPPSVMFGRSVAILLKDKGVYGRKIAYLALRVDKSFIDETRFFFIQQRPPLICKGSSSVFSHRFVSSKVLTSVL
jgi:hypothetical protein